MAVIEMLMRDENVIVDRLGAFQVFVEQIRVEGKIDIAQNDLKAAASRPSHECVLHGVFPYTYSCQIASAIISRMRTIDKM